VLTDGTGQGQRTKRMSSLMETSNRPVSSNRRSDSGLPVCVWLQANQYTFSEGATARRARQRTVRRE
jgi:hypothetical protein